MRRLLQSRHLTRWKLQADSKNIIIDVLCRKGETVSSISCDDWVLVVGITDGLAKVYSLDTGHFITILNCRYDQYDLSPPVDQVFVILDVGDHVIVTATSDGVVIVRNKWTYGAFYRETHHGDTPIMAIKIVPGSGMVVTGSRQEIVIMNHVRKMVGSSSKQFQGEYMEIVDRVNLDLYGVVTCLDSDGIFIIIGTSKSLLSWNIQSRQIVYKIDTGLFHSNPSVSSFYSSP